MPSATSLAWLSTICDELSHNISSFTNQEIAHTAWALARLSLPHTLLLDAMAEQLSYSASISKDHMGVSHAAVVAWAFARLHHQDRGVLRLVELVSVKVSSGLKAAHGQVIWETGCVVVWSGKDHAADAQAVHPHITQVFYFLGRQYPQNNVQQQYTSTCCVW